MMSDDLVKTLLNEPTASFKQSRVSLQAFNSITKAGTLIGISVYVVLWMIADKVRLLTRFLNEYRKESSQIRQLSAVALARCPVIRFIAATGDVHCEVSINNTLSIHKGNFVRETIGDGGMTNAICSLNSIFTCSARSSALSHSTVGTVLIAFL